MPRLSVHRNCPPPPGPGQVGLTVCNTVRLPLQTQSLRHTASPSCLGPGLSLLTSASVSTHCQTHATLRPHRHLLFSAVNLMWVSLLQRSPGCVEGPPRPASPTGLC